MLEYNLGKILEEKLLHLILQNGRLEYICKNKCSVPLVEILSFVISHYATSMHLVVIYNYLGHVCNSKFGIL
jgi:hypothetical protein